VANERPLRLEARAEADGSLLWSWTPPFAGDRNFNSEVLLTDNLAFISTNKATYAIDLASHQTVWSYPLMGRLALSQSGILYVRGKSQLAAINLK
jgi:outer membrane protein assembly factor BamB